MDLRELIETKPLLVGDGAMGSRLMALGLGPGECGELWDLENLLITPHIAGGTQFERQHVLDIFRENMRRYLDGDLPLRNQVDKARWF